MAEEETTRPDWVMPAWMEPYRPYILDGERAEELMNDTSTVETDAPMALHSCNVAGGIYMLARLYTAGLLVPPPGVLTPPGPEGQRPDRSAIFGGIEGMLERALLNGNGGQRKRMKQAARVNAMRRAEEAAGYTDHEVRLAEEQDKRLRKYARVIRHGSAVVHAQAFPRNRYMQPGSILCDGSYPTPLDLHITDSPMPVSCLRCISAIGLYRQVPLPVTGKNQASLKRVSLYVSYVEKTGGKGRSPYTARRALDQLHLPGNTARALLPAFEALAEADKLA